jgi:hypothetical protein
MIFPFVSRYCSQLDDAKKLVEFSKDIDAGGADFAILKELEIERDRLFGRGVGGRGGGRGYDDRGNGRRGSYEGGRGGYAGRGGGRVGYRNSNANYHDGGNSRSNREYRGRVGRERGGNQRRYFTSGTASVASRRRGDSNNGW